MSADPNKIRDFDNSYAGRMNPRNSYKCPNCKYFYNGWSEITLMGDSDCAHGDDRRITENIFNLHMGILRAAGIPDQNYREGNDMGSGGIPVKK